MKKLASQSTDRKAPATLSKPMNNDGNIKFRDRKAWAQFLLIMFAMLGLTIWGISGCCERDILGDCIHRTPGSTNSLSVPELDTLSNGTDEQAQRVIQRHQP